MKCTDPLTLSLCCHELVAWLPAERDGDGGTKCKTCCLFIHTHGHRGAVGKEHHCQYNIGNSSIQCQQPRGQMLLDACYITSGWQVFITFCMGSTYSAPAKWPKGQYIPFEIKLMFPGFQIIKRFSRTDKYCLNSV